MIALPLLLVFGIHPAPTITPDPFDQLPVVPVVTPPPPPPQDDAEEVVTTPTPEPPAPTPIATEATPAPTETPTPTVVDPAPSPVVAVTAAPTPEPTEVSTAVPTPTAVPAGVTPGPTPVRRHHERGAKPRRQRRTARHRNRLSRPNPPALAPRHVAAGPRILDRHSGSGTPRGRYYTVVPGDCLSLIAARYGRDWRIIAKENHLSDPDLIFPGQVLTL